MVLNIDDAPSQEEVREAARDATEQLDRWRFRSFSSLTGWLCSCALVYLFLAGHSLHAYWRPFGIIAFYVTLGVLLSFIYCAVMWCTTWSFLRDLRKTYMESTD